MKYALLALVFVALWTPLARSEGPWHVNGNVFKNVNAMQKGKEVTVSGRVSSGPIKNRFQIGPNVSNDEVKTRTDELRSVKFC